MNHAAIVDYESERIYGQRSFILHKLDDQHFEALNPDGRVLDLNGYCLDALDYIPGGGMQAETIYHPRPIRGRQAESVRGLTTEDIAQRNALAEKIIDEILAEERAS